MAEQPLQWPAAAASQELQIRISKAKVLCVGAGGIGCELLKTLTLTGFRNIQVIDLDTIETSNLNRQFLFRKWHVGQSKAAVAAEAVKCFSPKLHIVAHQGNIKDPKYDVDFFKGFDMVLNGLDNMEARRHVNRLTLAAGVPLVESGTEGYLGQVTVHLKGKTECFECQPKMAPKSYPVCTIRNTPDKPIHCVVWAKDLLFPRLFGRPEAVTDLDEGGAAPIIATPITAAQPPLPDPDTASAAAHATIGPSTDAAPQSSADVPMDGPSAREQAEEDASFFVKQEGESSRAYARRIFHRVFTSDIERVLRMEDLWQSRSPPKPLLLNELAQPSETEVSQGEGGAAAADVPASATAALGLTNPHTQLSLKELAALFLESVRQYLDHRPQQVGNAVFDKSISGRWLRCSSGGGLHVSTCSKWDIGQMTSYHVYSLEELRMGEDDLAVDFVAAAANLRMAAYNIPGLSLFDAKGMAGNIVHAVATTNAVIAGLITLEAMKLLACQPDACRGTFLQQHVSAKRMVQSSLLWPPSKSCAVCGTAQLHLTINTAATSLGSFVDKVLKKRLALVSPTVSTESFMYEEGPDLDEDEAAQYAAHRPTPMTDLPGGGIAHGAIVAVSDQAQAFEVSIVVSHKEEWDEDKEPEGFLLEGAVPQAAAATEATNGSAAEAAEVTTADSDVDLEFLDGPLDNAAETTASASANAADAELVSKGKRKRAAPHDAAPSAKRAELADGTGAVLADPDDDDVIVLE